MNLEIVKSIVVFDGTPAVLPGICRALNGDILVAYNTTADGMSGGTAHLIRSKDGGNTWEEPVLMAETKKPEGATHLSVGMTTLSNGNILYPYIDIRVVRQWDIRDIDLYVPKSEDHGYTWTNRDKVPCEAMEPISYGRIVELDDGTLLLPICGRYREEERYRSGVLKSYDRGNTWGDYSTIAFDNQAGEDVLSGFDETDIIKLPSGKILAILRQQFLDKEATLCRSVSQDGGKSWSAYEKTNATGTSPCIHLSPSGKLLLGRRSSVDEQTGEERYGVSMKYSEDQGKTWKGWLELVDPHGTQATTSGHRGYPAMVNLPDGKILVVFFSVLYSPEVYRPSIAGNFLRELI